MAHSPDVSSSGWRDHLPDLRIVLIGGRELHEGPSGKSSAGNIILGQSVFDSSRRTAQSEARQQKVLNRRVTVVDTPGWWWNYPRENTPKLDQIEIQNSVYLCPPGPHVFLLVIPVNKYLSQIDKKSLKEHLDLFKRDVLSHTIVLFTSLDPCSIKKVESKIKRNKTLRLILQQCRNRKHVLNISNREDRAQVKRLFEKIDALVKENRDKTYSVEEADGKVLREEMKVWTERASERFDRVQKQRRKLRALIEAGKVPPRHLRLVLIGGEFTAKSSAGNTILGKNAFNINKDSRRRTTRCEISHSLVENRQLTVVDSPGWVYLHTLQDTSELDKLEIESSVYLCTPGPHAVLLVIDLTTTMNASYLRSVQEHMSLFREEIWKHTLVLFTKGDWLGVKTVEERIESDEGLKWIVNKCENRYHVLNNLDHSDQTQVKELLEKIEEMWAGNQNPYYEVDLSRATEIEAKKEAEDKKASRLKKIIERQSRVLDELMEGQNQAITGIQIVLVGQKGSGKSLARNMIFLKELFKRGFDTAYLKPDKKTSTCVTHKGKVNGVKVTVVETPGWSRDTTPPDWVKGQVVHSVSLCAPGPHVFLLIVPVSRCFREKDFKDLVELLMPFTERVWRHCMVLFTWGDWINDRPVEDFIIREGRYIQELLEKCGNRYHLLNPHCFGDPVQVKDLFQKIIDIVTQNKECFKTEVKQRKFQVPPGQKKQPTMTEEEWNRREQELMERVMKALANEPDEPTVPSVMVARSMREPPFMSGDVPSEYGSVSGVFRIQRAHDHVSEWLKNSVPHSGFSSGFSSFRSSASYMGNTDESSLIHENEQMNHLEMFQD